MTGDRHISQFELVRFVDGEASAEEQARIASHLEMCDVCREAFTETRWASEELKVAYESIDRQPQDADGARSLLRSQLAHEGQGDSSGLGASAFTRTKLWPRYLYGAIGIAAAAALLFFVPAIRSSLPDLSASLPNRGLTPGMTRPVDVEQVCSAEDDDLDPEVSPSTQQTVFQEYGISRDNSARDFQVDYLISPQLGGTDDVRNLWPQSYKVTVWNARAKDQLERHLYQLVCEKKISLADAQHDIATNWIAAYQKYFHTSRPV